jgi:hypothetical protein
MAFGFFRFKLVTDEITELFQIVEQAISPASSAALRRTKCVGDIYFYKLEVACIEFTFGQVFFDYF